MKLKYILKKDYGHVALFAVLAFCLYIYCAWLFFWPLVECFYAMSLDPILLAEINKQVGFFIGAIVFIGGTWWGIRIIV